MSGGSYGYLHNRYGADDLRDAQDDMAHMANRLDELGYAEKAAKETTEIFLMIRQFEIMFRQFEIRMESIPDSLRHVWKSVEWWDSADSDEDGVITALTNY